MTGVLQGIRVIDVSRVLAGPLCGQMLADNGADVIKIEPPEGDMNRRFPTFVDGESTNFLSVNRGKLGCTINLKNQKGRELLCAMVSKVDIFIQNFLPETARKLGTDFESLHALNPDLIYVSISGYGTRGPLSDRPGYDQMVAAYCGVTSLTGEADRPPLNPGISALDISAGMLAYAGAVTALLGRSNGKARGQKVEVSLLGAGIQLLGYHALNWTIGRHLDHRMGRDNDKLVPHGPFHCLDGDIVIGAAQEDRFRKLCDLLDAPGLSKDPRFSALEQRIAHADVLRTELERRLAMASVAHWVDVFAKAGISCAPVNSLDVLFNEEQVRINDMIVEVPRRDGGPPMALLGLPFDMSDTPGKARFTPPSVGEDTIAVLQQVLGLDLAEIDGLRAAGIV